ncbi:MAG: hypothetical protein V4690_00685 [Patescibacteria group bacterium]
MNSKRLRMLAGVVLLISITFVPWWVSFLLMLAAVVYFYLYVEVLFLAFLLDLVYSPVSTFPYALLCTAFVVLVLSVLIKSTIRK